MGKKHVIGIGLLMVGAVLPLLPAAPALPGACSLLEVDWDKYAFQPGLSTHDKLRLTAQDVDTQRLQGCSDFEYSLSAEQVSIAYKRPTSCGYLLSSGLSPGDTTEKNDIIEKNRQFTFPAGEAHVYHMDPSCANEQLFVVAGTGATCSIILAVGYDSGTDRSVPVETGYKSGCGPFGAIGGDAIIFSPACTPPAFSPFAAPVDPVWFATPTTPASASFGAPWGSSGQCLVDNIVVDLDVGGMILVVAVVPGITDFPVVGTLDVYFVPSPTGGGVYTYCVSLYVDGFPVSPCDLVGAFVTTLGAIATVDVPEPDFTDPTSIIGVCTGDLTATDNGIGPTDVGVWVPCYIS